MRRFRVRVPASTRALICALILACSAKDREQPVSKVTKPLILDQAHNNGPRGFFWLPPMVSNPNPEGSNDRTLFPTVRIDEINLSSGAVTTIATYTRSSGTGGETITDSASHFHVNWHSRDFDLSLNAIYRIVVSLGGRDIGLADVDVVDNGSQLRNVKTNEYIGLVDGRTLPIKFFLNLCAPIECTALDSCHEVGVCSTTTGQCSNPTKADGASCSDGDLCTQVDVPPPRHRTPVRPRPRRSTSRPRGLRLRACRRHRSRSLARGVRL